VTPASISALVNLFVSVIGAFCYFIIGWLWSTSAWHRSFDLGWLVVALIFSQCVSTRIENGTLSARNYFFICLAALPGFIFELFADWGRHTFQLQSAHGSLVQFAIFSCLLLVWMVALIAFTRFGVALDKISTKHEATWNRTIWAGASVMTVSFVGGTVIILVGRSNDLGAQMSRLQSWFYFDSLLVYFLLTIKLTLPLILRRLRAVIDELHSPDIRF